MNDIKVFVLSRMQVCELDSTGTEKGSVAACCEHDNEPFASISDRKFSVGLLTRMYLSGGVVKIKLHGQIKFLVTSDM